MTRCAQLPVYFLLLLITTTTTILAAPVSLSPNAWATIATSASDSNPISKDSLSFYLPDTLNENVTQPVLLGFRSETDRLFIFDIDHNNTYSTDIAEEEFSDWVIQDTFSALSSCRTSKCFTQIDDDLYVLFDASHRFIKYNLVHESEGTIHFDEAYAGVYCLSNNGTHIFAVGTNPNIVIFDVDTEDFSFSADFIPNGQTLSCAMALADDVIYIFGEYGVLKYAFLSDTLSTVYGREYTLPFFNDSESAPLGHSQFLSSVASFTATDAHINNGLIWIKRNAYVYGYSSVTDKLLNCRVQHSETNVVGSTLFLVDGDTLMDFGGAVLDDSSANNLSATDRITLIDTSFLDDRFTFSDWYSPAHSIAINYTRGFVQQLVHPDQTHVALALSSLDFDVSAISINLLNPTVIVSGAADECEVCYDDDVFVGECGAIGGYCLSDGLRVDLLSPNTMNEDGVDIASVAYSIEVHSNVTDIASSASAGFVCNSFPIYPVYLSLTAQLYADDDFFLNFDYAYECNGCSVSSFNNSALYDFESTLVLNAASLGIEENVTMTILNQQSCLITRGSSEVYNCSHFPLPYLEQVYFEGIYQFQLFSSDTFLASNLLQLSLTPSQTKCAAGTGYDDATRSCSKCGKGSFSLGADLSSCISCNGVEGVTCSGGSDITVEYRYWVSGYDSDRERYLTLFDMNDSSEHILIGHICAFGQCCQLDEGCDYVQDFEGSILCNRGRDLETSMCTSCNDGYYELLSTNDCGECDYYENMWYLLGVFTLSFILVFYLAFCDAKPLDIMIDKVKKRESRKESPEKDDNDDADDDDDVWDDKQESSSHSFSSSDGDEDDDVARGMKKKKKKKKQKTKKQGKTNALAGPRGKSRKLSHVEQQQRAQAEKRSKVRIDFSYFVADSYVANSALLFQIFVYYFQGFAEILSNAGTRAYLSPIVNFFNFNFANDQIGSNDDGNNGFCAIPFTDALGEIMISLIFPALMLFSLFLISIFCNRGCGNNYYAKPYVRIAFFRIWIIIVGLLFRAPLQIITCTHYPNPDDDDTWVHFFFDEACFGAAWWVAMFALVILLLVFVGIYIKLFQQSNEDRYQLRNPYTKLVQAYKPRFWYWEAVNTTRRFMITMFVTLSFIGRGYSNLILCLLLLFYLIAHLTIYPFKHRRNNRIETFCLLSLLIAFIGINFEDIAASIFLSLFLGVVVFLPIFISLYYMIKLCLSCKAYYDGNDEHFLDAGSHAEYEDRVSKIKNRVLAKRDTVFFKKRHSDLMVAPDPTDDGGNKRKMSRGSSKDVELTTLRFNRGAGGKEDTHHDTANGYTRGKNQSNGHESDSNTSCGLSE